MTISFIIPARNEAENIGKTIEAILRQPAELVKEIIVVDNGSTDDTVAVASAYPKTRVLKEAVPGTNRARQTGFESATGDIVAFIDADNWLPENWSATAIKYLTRKNVAGVSGAYHYRGLGWFSAFMTFNAFLVVAYPVYFFVHYILGAGGVVLGGNLAAWREKLKQAGGFDTQYRFFGDDVSTGKRLRSVGRILFTHKLVVYASPRRFQKQGYFKTTFRYFMNFAWVILFNKPFTK